MNGELQLPDMLQCITASGKVNGTGSDMSLLERQRAIMKWQKDQNFQRGGRGYVCSTTGLNGGSFSMQAQVDQVQNFQGFMVGGDFLPDDAADHSVKADPGLGNGWADLGNFDMPCLGFGSSAVLASGVAASGFDMNSAITRTLSCPPAVTKVSTETKSRESSLSEKISCPSERESFKKRKGGLKVQNSKIMEADDKKDKKIKICAEEEESKITEQASSKNNAGTNSKRSSNGKSNRQTSEASKENSKVSEVQKPDYIHVRARRGQATDSHSLAERVRREKISERMKYLQDIVPGCNKITGKAGMLDEIINYVQSLQRQVEFLSMKLAAVNPRIDFNIDDLFAKEIFPAYAPSFPAMGMADMANSAYLQFNQAQQMAAYCGMEMGMTPSDMSLRRTISAPVSMPETLIDSSCYTQMQPSWEADLSTFYSAAFDQGRLQSFPSQQLTGSMEARSLKREI